jgi:hypothetical protein
MRVLVRGCPVPYAELVEDLPGRIELLTRASKPVDFVHAFVEASTGLEAALKKYRRLIRPAGMIWVSWRKRTSRQSSALSEDVIRSAALKAGLVDVKVCAVDEVWSGLKLVIPVAQREAPRAP